MTGRDVEPAVIVGEVLERDPGAGRCDIRTWEKGGYFWWECRGGGHIGNGQHTTEYGRRAALSTHATQVRVARDKGQIPSWTPVDREPR